MACLLAAWPLNPSSYLLVVGDSGGRLHSTVVAETAMRALPRVAAGVPLAEAQAHYAAHLVGEAELQAPVPVTTLQVERLHPEDVQRDQPVADIERLLRDLAIAGAGEPVRVHPLRPVWAVSYTYRVALVAYRIRVAGQHFALATAFDALTGEWLQYVPAEQRSRGVARHAS